MTIYSISDLEKLSGVKAHTIRAWEHRYHLLSPARTPTNIRYYTDEHLRLLLDIVVLNRHGLKIGQLAQMPQEAITAEAARLSRHNGHNATRLFQDMGVGASLRAALALALIDLDEAAFDEVFTAYAAQCGFERAMFELIYPFLEKLNLLWLTQNAGPAQEKFSIALLRRKIAAAIDREAAPPADADTFVLYLSRGEEREELNQLFLHYLLRHRSRRVVDLGPDTALSEVAAACAHLQPRYVLTILQEKPQYLQLQEYLDQAAYVAAPARLLVCGTLLFEHEVRLPANAQAFDGLQSMIKFIEG